MKNPILAAAILLLLPTARAETEYDRRFAELEAADRAADAAWDAVTDRDSFLARRAELRAKYLAAVGTFPERTPLNARVVATVPRAGYRIEKILFESRPGFHVPALAFVPDAAKFAPPYPAVLVTCGHSGEGKACPTYQRACVMGATEGFLMLICDPIDQGERIQSTDGWCCHGHNQFGSKAHGLGLSAAHFRIWDGMRCLDYLQSRPDVKGDRLGLMGNSGGGTMTALIAAADPRVRAACPSCYVTTIRDVVRSIGPQDAEQCIWGQLRDGVNHAALVLMAEGAVRLQFSDGDFFPIEGARSTYGVVRRTADRVGLGARYSATVVKGPHGWKESSRRSSLDWMRQWLMDERPNGRTDADYVALDATFDPKAADCGLPEAEAKVAPGGSVLNLPGERVVSDILVDLAIGAQTPRLVFRETAPTRHSFYGAKSAAEENAVMSLMLGRNLVEERAAEILAKARATAAQGGPKPVLVAEDDWIRPAERAFADAPELFAGFRPLGDGTFRTSVRNGTAKPAVPAGAGSAEGGRPLKPTVVLTEVGGPVARALAQGGDLGVRTTVCDRSDGAYERALAGDGHLFVFHVTGDDVAFHSNRIVRLRKAKPRAQAVFLLDTDRPAAFARLCGPMSIHCLDLRDGIPPADLTRHVRAYVRLVARGEGGVDYGLLGNDADVLRREARTQRLHDAKWGVFNHYLGRDGMTAADWNARVASFDVKLVADQLQACGAKFYFITLMQGRRWMLAPNATFDRIGGIRPGEACARRDLPMELADELSRRGIDLYLYYTGDGPYADRELGPRFGLTRARYLGVNEPFVRNWAAVLEEYAVRYGDRVRGWWIDGCYGSQFLRYTDALLDHYAAAVRKGSAGALVAMNNGVRDYFTKYYSREDFTCGEFNDFYCVPKSRFVDGAQAFALIPMGRPTDSGCAGWSRTGLIRPARQIADYVKLVNDRDGVVAIDVHVEPNGAWAPEQLEALKLVGRTTGTLASE